MDAVNQKFRIALITKFGTQLDAAKQLGIDNTSLSFLVRHRRMPTVGQRRKLRAYFSDYQLRRMFPRESNQKIEEVSQ